MKETGKKRNGTPRGSKSGEAQSDHEKAATLANRFKAARNQLDDALVKPTPAQRKKAVEMASMHGIEVAHALQLVHSINQLEALALHIARELDWEHMGDAITRAEWVAGLSELTPQELEREFDYRQSGDGLANSYISVRRVIDATEQGAFVFAIGHLANVARHLLGDSVRNHLSATNSAKATKRWSWLEEVQDEVFSRRATDKAKASALGKSISRAKSLDLMLDDIRHIYDRKATENNAAKLTRSRENALRLLEKWCRASGVT